VAALILRNLLEVSILVIKDIGWFSFVAFGRACRIRMQVDPMTQEINGNRVAYVLIVNQFMRFLVEAFKYFVDTVLDSITFGWRPGRKGFAAASRPLSVSTTM
jgi:hypothetical protein